MRLSDVNAVLLATFLGTIVGGCSRSATIIGIWRSEDAGEHVTLVFEGDGHFHQHYTKKDLVTSVDFEKGGTYTFGASNTLVMRFEGLDIPATISYSLAGDQLSLGWPGDTRVKIYRRERD
jgi:hypothetical protein